MHVIILVACLTTGGAHRPIPVILAINSWGVCSGSRLEHTPVGRRVVRPLLDRELAIHDRLELVWTTLTDPRRILKRTMLAAAVAYRLAV